MLTLGFLTFMAPMVLIAGALLPLVWLLLRLTPPAVRRLDFPAARLLFNLKPTERTPARTPPWLVILRIFILTLALVGLADPVLTAQRGEGEGPLLVVFDDGWAAANRWEDRLQALRNVLERADHHDRQVAFLTTAPTPTPQPALRFISARDALGRAGDMLPRPWPTDRAAAAAQVNALTLDKAASAVWFSDGVADTGEGDAALLNALKRFARTTVIDAGDTSSPLVLAPPQRALAENTGNRIAVTLRRVSGDDATSLAHTVRAVDSDGQVIARTTVPMEGNARSGTAAFDLPSELANRIARFDVEGHPSAGATVLADARWQRRPVGVASASDSGISVPLLEDAYYIRQALGPFAEVRGGSLEDLLSRPLAVMIMASGGRILENEIDRLTSWVEGGGILVRFAGPRLDTNVDPLLPVRLRSGGRSFGGALSWNEPATLAPFPPTSPFKDMTIPSDVTIQTQVLAEPSPDLPAKTWARLTDGTPLITAERRGQGWVVLFHVTATPDWSSLPLSGLFVDLLRRMIDMSTGVAASSDAVAPEGMLAPLQLMNGLGHLVPPGPTAAPLAARALADGAAGVETPPGLYGSPSSSVALNLSPRLIGLEPLKAFPADATRLTFDGMARERALKPWFLMAALSMLLIDLIISFALRGLSPILPAATRASKAAGTVALLIVLLANTGVFAADPKPAAEIDATAGAAILQTRLAYILTGKGDLDRVALAGLTALTKVLEGRTSAEMGTPAAVDLAAGVLTADTLTPYPILYWRITPETPRPGPKAASALSAYLHRGGMVVFDAPEQTGAMNVGAGAKLDDVLRAIDLPQLVAMTEDHVLNRSFYLLHGLPGRFSDATVYVEKGSTANDGVSSVIIGGNDWAAAWARDGNNVPMYPVVPGGETQREMAYRAGVNMVMYALTGNYKSDQVHLPAIMQRLTQ